MIDHFRMCASAYRDNMTIDASVYAGLPDRLHDARITRIDLENPKVLEIYIEFTRRAGGGDKTIWTWESHCVVPYSGQQRVELIGTFEGKTFRFGASIPDSKPDYVACGFIVIARKVEHHPHLGCLSVLAGSEIPQGYEQVYPKCETGRDSQPDSGSDCEPKSKADCEEWRKENCA